MCNGYQITESLGAQSSGSWHIHKLEPPSFPCLLQKDSIFGVVCSCNPGAHQFNWCISQTLSVKCLSLYEKTCAICSGHDILKAFPTQTPVSEYIISPSPNSMVMSVTLACSWTAHSTFAGAEAAALGWPRWDASTGCAAKGLWADTPVCGRTGLVDAGGVTPCRDCWACWELCCPQDGAPARVLGVQQMRDRRCPCRWTSGRRHLLWQRCLWAGLKVSVAKLHTQDCSPGAQTCFATPVRTPASKSAPSFDACHSSSVFSLGGCSWEG